MSPSSLLSYTIGKLLASELGLLLFVCRPMLHFKANAHRVFVTNDSLPASPTGIHSLSGNLTGIVSVVDSVYSKHLYPGAIDVFFVYFASFIFIGTFGEATWS